MILPSCNTVDLYEKFSLLPKEKDPTNLIQVSALITRFAKETLLTRSSYQEETRTFEIRIVFLSQPDCTVSVIISSGDEASFQSDSRSRKIALVFRRTVTTASLLKNKEFYVRNITTIPRQCPNYAPLYYFNELGCRGVARGFEECQEWTDAIQSAVQKGLELGTDLFQEELFIKTNGRQPIVFEREY